MVNNWPIKKQKLQDGLVNKYFILSKLKMYKIFASYTWERIVGKQRNELSPGICHCGRTSASRSASDATKYFLFLQPCFGLTRNNLSYVVA